MDATHPTEQQLKVRMDRLPMLPAVVARLAALDRDADDYFERVYELLEEDPPFALRMLKLANSAMSAPVMPIATLRAAIARLGTNQVTYMVTTAALSRVFVPQTPAQRSLWVHAVQTATAARAIASRSERVHVDVETAYLAALLHDIGRFVLFQDQPEPFPAADTKGFAGSSALLSHEQEQSGWDHAEIGWRVCHAWNIPEHIAVLIRDHHLYDLDQHDELSRHHQHELTVLQMADAISLVLTNVDDLQARSFEEIREVLRERCVHPRWPVVPLEPDELAAMLPWIIDEADAMLSGLMLS